MPTPPICWPSIAMSTTKRQNAPAKSRYSKPCTISHLPFYLPFSHEKRLKKWQMSTASKKYISLANKAKALIFLAFLGVSRLSAMVEMGGIEPPSESACSRLSPGAVGYPTAGGCVSPSRSKPTRLPGRVASLCMVRSKLCARTDAANRRPRSRAAALPGWTGLP